jgi:hypothetical protein
MASKPSNERSSPRSLLFCPISVTFPEGEAHGILRDISSGGIFFYSSLKPALQTSINFVLHLKDKKLRGKGEVVRVEQSVPGAAIGVAVKISGYDES